MKLKMALFIFLFLINFFPLDFLQLFISATHCTKWNYIDWSVKHFSKAKLPYMQQNILFGREWTIRLSNPGRYPIFGKLFKTYFSLKCFRGFLKNPALWHVQSSYFQPPLVSWMVDKVWDYFRFGVLCISDPSFLVVYVTSLCFRAQVISCCVVQKIALIENLVCCPENQCFQS